MNGTVLIKNLFLIMAFLSVSFLGTGQAAAVPLKTLPMPIDPDGRYLFEVKPDGLNPDYSRPRVKEVVSVD